MKHVFKNSHVLATIAAAERLGIRFAVCFSRDTGGLISGSDEALHMNLCCLQLKYEKHCFYPSIAGIYVITVTDQLLVSLGHISNTLAQMLLAFNKTLMPITSTFFRCPCRLTHSFSNNRKWHVGAAM